MKGEFESGILAIMCNHRKGKPRRRKKPSRNRKTVEYQTSTKTTHPGNSKSAI
jgi:hypothetical protein